MTKKTQSAKLTPYEAAARTQAAEDLRRWTGLVMEAFRLGEAFLEQHPESCRCTFCRYQGENIRQEMRGAVWALAHARDDILNLVPWNRTDRELMADAKDVLARMKDGD